MKDKEFEEFKNLVSKFSEKYTDYLIIARDSHIGIMWRASDSTWGVGAAHRFIVSSEEQDRFREIDGMMEEEDAE